MKDIIISVSAAVLTMMPFGVWAQQPGSGIGPGFAPGSGMGPGRVVCRTVFGTPGSGMGPQRVCERVVPRCRTVFGVPGSGMGPQRVCD